MISITENSNLTMAYSVFFFFLLDPNRVRTATATNSNPSQSTSSILRSVVGAGISLPRAENQYRRLLRLIMCIISQSASVNGTEILVGPNEANDRQVVVYSNKVGTKHPDNFMVLAVPSTNISEDIQFHDLTEYPSIFEDCRSMMVNTSRGLRSFRAKSKLQVFQVGSYDVSIAQNKGELEKLDSSKFGVTQSLLRFMDRKYTDEYGFVICKLKKGDHTYHPMAYSHSIRDGYVFVPTVHYHGEGEENLGKSLDVAEDWRHQIYIVNKGVVSSSSDSSKAAAMEFVETYKSKDMKWKKDVDEINREKLGFPIASIRSFDRLLVKGRAPNVDIQYAL
eukprot:gb/GECG01003795.1/.p1 GENE.gb/GECG01003795.1/~~gb/GECG01003795.1/.p1  ORF type:complete len:336 (+),score=33.25 gb/GECG01003795.1/:1-1008(+)